MIRPRSTVRTVLAGLIAALSPLEALAINGENGNGHSNGRLSARSPLQPEITLFSYDPRTGTLTQSNYAQILPPSSDLYQRIRALNIGRKTPLLDSTAGQVLTVLSAIGGAALIKNNDVKYGIALSGLAAIFVTADLSARRSNAALPGKIKTANSSLLPHANPIQEGNSQIRELREDEAADYELKRDIYERIDELNNSLEKLTWEKMNKNEDDAISKDVTQTRLWKLKKKGPKMYYEDMHSELEKIEPEAERLISKYPLPKK